MQLKDVNDAIHDVMAIDAGRDKLLHTYIGQLVYDSFASIILFKCLHKIDKRLFCSWDIYEIIRLAVYKNQVIPESLKNYIKSIR